MYKRILVAIDGSTLSTQLLKEAIKLAKSPHARVKLIYVIDEYFVDYAGVGIEYTEYQHAMQKTGTSILKKAENALTKAKVKFSSELLEITDRQDHIEQKIVDAASDWRADVLIIGTHGHRGLRHFILGSVAEAIIRIAKTPVLLIRAKKQ